jgi:spoIIIJ-associated protein
VIERKPVATTAATEPGGLLEQSLAAIESLANEVIRCGKFDLSVSIRRQVNTASDEPGTENPDFTVEFSGNDSDLLLERNAELLNAFEHVILKAVRLDEELLGKITFDSEDWRRLRIEELKLMAQVAAERVVETGEPFHLAPMNARERRIIHLALSDQPRVRTESEGTGADRKVVIMPAPSRSGSD